MLTDTSETLPLRKRIEAAEQLLGYEAPEEIVAEAKAFLITVAEDRDTAPDFRLDALKLLRKAESPKVTQRTVRAANDGKSFELGRELEISKRRMKLVEVGAWPPPSGWCDDLTGPDYVPSPPPDEPDERDLAEVLRKARLAHLQKANAKGAE